MPKYIVTVERDVAGTRRLSVMIEAADAASARERVDALDFAGKLPDGTFEESDAQGPRFIVEDYDPAMEFDHFASDSEEN